jgi:hypothetical protein
VITTTPAQLLGTGSTLKSEDRDRGSSSTDLASEFPIVPKNRHMNGVEIIRYKN